MRRKKLSPRMWCGISYDFIQDWASKKYSQKFNHEECPLWTGEIYQPKPENFESPPKQGQRKTTKKTTIQKQKWDEQDDESTIPSDEAFSDNETKDIR